MFTGIIEEVGKIISVKKGPKSSILSIQGDVIFYGLKLGDSISVNGVCLTVSSYDKNIFNSDVMSETLNRSSLGLLKVGSGVNLERAMAADGRFGGHIVSGHIDGIGTISTILKDDNAVWFTVKTTEKLIKYIVEKGSIAIDGISLTITDVQDNYFRVSIIPHTSKSTILLSKGVGDTVNLENDIVGKYIEKFLSLSQPKDKSKSNITAEFLAKAGF